LQALFPTDYKFAELEQGENLPLGHYELLDISGYKFDTPHSVSIVAYPAELESRIPRRN
jgi:hypothetical protein